MTAPHPLEALIKERILILDGAMGTMIQRVGLQEQDFRGERFADHPGDLKGNNDLLVLTRPDVIRDIHRAYLEAGADIIETDTFSANAISQGEYGLQSAVRDINVVAARLAKEVAQAVGDESGRPRFVAGSIGPTNETLSLSRDVDNPAFRSLDFDSLKAAFAEQIDALMEGGVDFLLIETIIDTLSAKASLFAVEEVFEARGERCPVWISMTIPDASGRLLSGQTVESFWISVEHIQPMVIGINCALGAEQMRPHVQTISRIAPCSVLCYPNAGLPNEFGEYDQTPAQMAALIGDFARSGWLNAAGGCCGTSPDHIAAIAAAVGAHPPRAVPAGSPNSRYCGMEHFEVRPETGFVMVGERTNVTGSRRFQRMIKNGNFERALSVARQQIEGGANIIDINMDEGLLDSEEAMQTFLRLIASEPDIARVPIMVDSSKFSIIEAALKNIQGKAIVNSISLKEGPDVFRAQARTLRRYGAAVVVMAFDETGQATDVEQRVEIAKRAFGILIDELGFAATDILFDPNILTVATGIEEHNEYALNFIEATRQIKALFPDVKVIGGVSNLSFSFRGNDYIREAMHAAFLYHAIGAGMNMGIVNAGQLAVYEDIDPELLEAVEDVLFNRRADATERLVELAMSTTGGSEVKAKQIAAWREGDLDSRIAHAMRHGILDNLEDDITEALEAYATPLEIIEGPLMRGMNIVGDLFGVGKMFLPQVVKSARVMKKAVAFLLPYFDLGEGAKRAGKILLATVKGDVHDIGKNIVGVVLGCNNFEIIDVGVMASCEKILAAAKEHDVDIIGLSGLITPSLDEMVNVAEEMQRLGFTVPLLIGGATTSRRHTAVKIAPRYEGPVVHVIDASRAPSAASALINKERRGVFLEENLALQVREREIYEQRRTKRAMHTLAAARENALRVDWSEAKPLQPSFLGLRSVAPSLETLRQYIDWSPFFATWQLRGAYPKILEHPSFGESARELFAHAQEMLDDICAKKLLEVKGVYGFFPAASDGDDILILDEARKNTRTRFNMLRQQRVKAGDEQANLSLADFIAPVGSGHDDYIGAFAVTSGIGCAELAAAYEADHDDYNSIMIKSIADRLAEAFAEYVHLQARIEWGIEAADTHGMSELLKEKYRGIRPAFGYPACPEHTEKYKLFELLSATEKTGIELTEHLAMTPTASVCGLIFGGEAAHYFTVSPIGRDQVEDYAQRKNMTFGAAEKWLAPHLSYK